VASLDLTTNSPGVLVFSAQLVFPPLIFFLHLLYFSSLFSSEIGGGAKGKGENPKGQLREGR
jgi:hypothetical protein